MTRDDNSRAVVTRVGDAIARGRFRANASIANLNAVLTAGRQTHVAKPFELEEIVSIVNVVRCVTM